MSRGERTKHNACNLTGQYVLSSEQYELSNLQIKEQSVWFDLGTESMI